MSQFSIANGSFVGNNQSITEVIMVSNSSGGIINTFGGGDGGSSNVTISGGLPNSSNTIGGVFNSNPSGIYSNTQMSSNTATPLPSVALTNWINIMAYANNVGTIYLGQAGVTANTGWPLTPGATISYAVSNLSAIYMVGTNNSDRLAFSGN